MSRHTIFLHSKKLDADLTVVVGYDRELDNIYCYVKPDSGCDDGKMIYTSITDDSRQGSVDVLDFVAPLDDIGLTLPWAIIANVQTDYLSRAGNTVTFYTPSGEVERSIA